MFKHWVWAVASVLVFAASPALTQEVGDTIEFEHRGQTVEGVVSKIDGERYLVEVKTGPRAGKQQMVHRSKIVGGDRPRPGAGDEPAGAGGGEIKVGSKIRMKEFFTEEIVDAVVTEIMFEGKVYRVKVTSGKTKGETTTVRHEDIVRGDAKAPGKGAADGYKVGDAIRFEYFGDEVTGTITGLKHGGKLYDVDVTSGKRAGRSTMVWRDDVLGPADGKRPGEGAGDDDLLQQHAEQVAALKVGSKVRYRTHGNKTEEGVVLEVSTPGQMYRVLPNDAERDNQWRLVSAGDFLFGDDKADKFEDLKPGDTIKFKAFGGGVAEGIVNHFRGAGKSVLEVEVTSGRDKGEIKTVWLKDVLAKTGHQKLDVASAIEGVPLSGEEIRLRLPMEHGYKALADYKGPWSVPPAEAAVSFPAVPKPIVVQNDDTRFTTSLCGAHVLISSGSPQTVQLVDLKKGTVAATVKGLSWVSDSPSGNRVLMSVSTSRFGDRVKQKYYHLFAVAPGGKLEHLKQIEVPGDAKGALTLVADDVLCHRGRSGMSLHDLSNGRPTLSTKLAGLVKTYDPRHNVLIMHGPDRYKSPSNDGSMVYGSVIRVMDAATGRVLGQRPLPMIIFQCALAPDGKRLIFRADPDGNGRGGGDVVTVDMSTGKVLGRLSFGKPSKSLAWIDDRFVLISGDGFRYVLDSSTHLIVKKIEHGEHVRKTFWSPDTIVSSMRNPRHTRQAIISVTPTKSLGLTDAADQIDPEAALSVGPGSSMALDINSTFDRKEVEAIFTDRLVDAGINIDPNAKHRLSVKTKRTSTKRKFREGANNEQNVKVEEIKVTLELRQGGQTLWSTELVKKPPFSVMVRKGETLQQAVDRISGQEAEKRMMQGIPLPTRIMSDQMLEQLPSVTIQ